VAIRSNRQYRLTPPSRRTTPSRASTRCGWSSDSANTARHRLECASDPTSRCADPASPHPGGGSGSSSQSNWVSSPAGWSMIADSRCRPAAHSGHDGRNPRARNARVNDGYEPG
jgi:hypothetical protein